jgi:hypothetical protein
MRGHINFDAKITGKRSAGKPHATFDEAGDGNVAILSQRAIARPYVRPGKAGMFSEKKVLAETRVGVS